MEYRRDLKSSRRIVIKVGTNILREEDGKVNLANIEKLVEQMAVLSKGGLEVIFVTSGAIGAGMGVLGLKERPITIALKQAAAAVGQSRLMQAYEELFAAHGIIVAQILLTGDDFNDRKRYLNSRNALTTLLDLGVIPIINENDTVAVEEIKLGDNDNLSAQVACLMDADLLVILTDIDGFYTVDPRHGGGELVKTVAEITPQMEEAAGGSGTHVGTGGMYAKLQAAKMVSGSGEYTVVANGAVEDVILRIMEGEEIGTLFLPSGDRMSSRKRWIAFTLKPQGTLKVDDGAREALLRRGKSLLSIGITEAQGEFEIGDAVRIVDKSFAEIARGLASYSSDEVRKIIGLRAKDIEAVLGYKYCDEVVHRDNMVLFYDKRPSDR